MPAPRPLVNFYLGTAPDDHGRTFDAILAHDDEWLEYTHNFIQWLFPLTSISGANPTAPTLDAAQIAEFRGNPALRIQLLRALDRMLGFYGLARTPDRINKAPDWEQRKSLWFTHPSHNHLRITRILKCLNTLALEQEARIFYDSLVALKKIEPDCGIPSTAFAYWANAVTH
ncbi:MAG: opioid growth factor receptor-related protein [Sulfuricella sp.]|nr:opioid growth factor receptor-related protein [Sulfuricella sp.]